MDGRTDRQEEGLYCHYKTTEKNTATIVTEIEYLLIDFFNNSVKKSATSALHFPVEKCSRVIKIKDFWAEHRLLSLEP